MQNEIIRKGLVIGTIFILFSLAFLPSSQAIITKESNKPISNGNILYVGGSGSGNRRYHLPV